MVAGQRFELGQVVATPGCLAALAVAGVQATDLLARHVIGDWGDVCPADKRANDAALADEGRIFSAYKLPGGGKVWVITEADRSSTCCLLPDEY